MLSEYESCQVVFVMSVRKVSWGVCSYYYFCYFGLKSIFYW